MPGAGGAPQRRLRRSAARGRLPLRPLPDPVAAAHRAPPPQLPRRPGLAAVAEAIGPPRRSLCALARSRARRSAAPVTPQVAGARLAGARRMAAARIADPPTATAPPGLALFLVGREAVEAGLREAILATLADRGLGPL